MSDQDHEIRDKVDGDLSAVGQVFARLVPDEARTWPRRLGALPSGVRRDIVTLMAIDRAGRVLRFFRDAGFAAGPFLELELELPPQGGDDGETRGDSRG